MQSHFSSQSLAEIFRDLYLSERTGTLVLSQDSLESRICFDRGLIQYAESSAPGRDLGQMLIEQGVISPGAVAEAEKDGGGSSTKATLQTHHSRSCRHAARGHRPAAGIRPFTRERRRRSR